MFPTLPTWILPEFKHLTSFPIVIYYVCKRHGHKLAENKEKQYQSRQALQSRTHVPSEGSQTFSNYMQSPVCWRGLRALGTVRVGWEGLLFQNQTGAIVGSALFHSFFGSKVSFLRSSLSLREVRGFFFFF